MGKYIDKQVDQVTVKNILANDQLSKSEKMRQLFLEGVEVGQIAQMMNVRYNFVYNVVQNFEYTTEQQLDVKKTKVIGDKKAEIIRLLNEGKTITEVCKELKAVYNYVWKIAKEGTEDGTVKPKK